MGQPWIKCRTVQKRILAALSVPLVIMANHGAGARGQDTHEPRASAPSKRAAPGATGAAQAMEPAGLAQLAGPNRRVYSIINLEPDGLDAYLNERGEAAFSSFLRSSGNFFDGDRIHVLRGAGNISIGGLNDRGLVIGVSWDDAQPIGNMRAYTWTLARGTRLLPGFGNPFDVNNRNQVAGHVLEMDMGRAVRWDPDGRIRLLGPGPPWQSTVRAINDRGIAAGFAYVADGAVHALLWDPAGTQRELGSLGGDYASADFINERGQVAGHVSDRANRRLGFFWSASSGMVPLDPQRAGELYISDLNDQGNIAGFVQSSDQAGFAHVAFRWSPARGIAWLRPIGPDTITEVSDLNNRNQMVGSVWHPVSGGRALRWDGGADPVDLNTQLYRPPPGLVLYSGRAINDAGTILARSSAGLVMLRPGTRGTDAPVLGPITGLPERILVDQEVGLTVGFTDNSPSQTHSAAVAWEDNCTSPHPSVREAAGVGQVSFQHRFCSPGLYRVTVRVTDSGGRTTSMAQDYIVYQPTVPAISGQGALVSTPERAGRGTQALRFMLWAPLAGSSAAAASQAKAGQAVVRMAGPFQFLSDRVDTPYRTGNLIRVEGTGHYNGRAGYRFLVEASDGDRQGAAGNDRLRVRVAHTEAGGIEVVDYDNGALANSAVSPASSQPGRTRVVEGGITLHD